MRILTPAGSWTARRSSFTTGRGFTRPSWEGSAVGIRFGIREELAFSSTSVAARLSRWILVASNVIQSFTIGYLHSIVRPLRGCVALSFLLAKCLGFRRRSTGTARKSCDVRVLIVAVTRMDSFTVTADFHRLITTLLALWSLGAGPAANSSRRYQLWQNSLFGCRRNGATDREPAVIRQSFQGHFRHL